MYEEPKGHPVALANDMVRIAKAKAIKHETSDSGLETKKTKNLRLETKGHPKGHPSTS